MASRIHRKALKLSKRKPRQRKKDVAQAIEEHSENVAKWLSELNNTLIAGFSSVTEAIRAGGQPLPSPQPQTKGRFTLILKNDQVDFGYDFDVSGVTDAEGEPITDDEALAAIVKEVTSDNEEVLSATEPNEDGEGTLHVGTSGSATLTGKAWLNQASKDAGEDPAVIAAEPFTITTGDPAAITEASFGFDVASGGTPAE